MILLMLLRSSLKFCLLITKLAGLTLKRLSQPGAVLALFYYQTLVWCCQGFGAEAPKAKACDLLVAAASDLSDLEADLAGLLPDCKTRFTFGSSGLLRQQIRNGAPYDLFLSANSQYINELLDAGLIANDTVHVYAYGQLALWSKRGLGWRDLASTNVNRIAIANPTLAPYGKAARESLQHEPKLWSTVQSKLVFGENVRQAFQFAATGNADVCLTSYSLVRSIGGVLVDPKMYNPIAQAAGVIRRPRGNATAARRLLDALLSVRGQELVRRYGLLPAAMAGQTRPK